MAAPTEYQWVITSTNYDSDPKHPRWLRFDGIDDYLNLPYMGLYAGGSASVVVARSMASSLANQSVISEGETSSTNSMYMLDSSGIAYGSGVFIRNSASTTLLYTLMDAYTLAPRTITSFIDTGSNVKRYGNSNVSKNNNYTRVGDLILTTTTIGALIRTNISN